VDEDAGSVVPSSCVEKKPVIAGITSKVIISGKSHIGKITAVG